MTKHSIKQVVKLLQARSNNAGEEQQQQEHSVMDGSDPLMLPAIPSRTLKPKLKSQRILELNRTLDEQMGIVITPRVTTDNGAVVSDDCSSSSSSVNTLHVTSSSSISTAGYSPDSGSYLLCTLATAAAKSTQLNIPTSSFSSSSSDECIVRTPRNTTEQLERIVYEGDLSQLQAFVKEHLETTSYSTSPGQDTHMAKPGNSSIGKRLLKYKFTNQQCTILHLLCKSNNEHVSDMISYLIDECDMDVNVTDGHESTPLFYACASGHEDAAACLLSRGALVNIKDSVGHFPLMVALRNAHQDIIQLLMYSDADVNLTATKGDTVVHMLAQKGDVEMLQFLLDQQRSTFNSVIQLNARNRHDESALFYCLHDPVMFSFLINAMKTQVGMVEMNKSLAKTNSVGYNLFHKCAEVANLESFSILIDHVPEAQLTEMLNVRDSYLQNTPLHIAVLHENEEMVRLWCQSREVNVNLQNKKGETALHIALKENMFSICQILLECGYARVNIPNKDGDTCQMLTQSNHLIPYYVLLLIEANAYSFNNGDDTLQTADDNQNTLTLPKGNSMQNLHESSSSGQKVFNRRSLAFLKPSRKIFSSADVRKLMGKLRHTRAQSHTDSIQ